MQSNKMSNKRRKNKTKQIRELNVETGTIMKYDTGKG